jgi:hypothetical protein
VRTQANPAKDLAENTAYYQVEVSELVKHVAHLPPLAHRRDPPNMVVHKLMRSAPQTRTFAQIDTNAADGGLSAIFSQASMATVELGFFPPPPKPKGIALLPNKHHVLEVRPMRALRPMLSTGNEFCAPQSLSTVIDGDPELHRLRPGAKHATGQDRSCELPLATQQRQLVRPCPAAV